MLSRRALRFGSMGALGAALALAVTPGAGAGPGPDSGAPGSAGQRAVTRPGLDDYKHFRALVIDLEGRMPTRDEIGTFERGFEQSGSRFLDGWIDARLAAGAHGARLTRTYLDLLRLETSPAFLYTPTPNVLRRVKILGPDKRETYVYFRRFQRRTRPETDGEFCLTEKETGLQVKMTNQVAPGGAAIPVDAKVLEANTVLVRPWWLYRDDRAAQPTERYGDSWKPKRAYQPRPELLVEPDGTPTLAVRVCREEALTAEVGTIYASGRDTAAAPESVGRQSPAPIDLPHAKAHKGEPVSCRSATAFAMSADCGCGVGLEACLPGDGNTKDPMGFVLPARTTLGLDAPFEEKLSGYSDWHKLWWAQEAEQLLGHLFSEDRDFREVLTGKWTWVNGPLAQFYRATAPSAAGGRAKGFATVGITEPIVDPGAVPAKPSPNDFDTWVRVKDRGPLAAGIATTPAFLTKYASRRARGAALYTTFLCKPFAADKSALAPSTDPDLRKRPGCASCHTTLEPLAAYFTRIVETDFVFLAGSVFPVENASCRADAQGKTPSFCGPYYDPVFSDATRALLRGAYASPENADLGPPGAGKELAGSPDFATCAVARVAEAFLGRPLSQDDAALAASLQDVFAKGGYRMKPLVSAVLRSDAYARGNAWSSKYLRGRGEAP